MIAFARHLAQQCQPQVAARDTGCVFPHGVHGDVRVRLLTDNPDKAAACGRKLHEWGLPLIPELIAMPRTQGVIALDLAARPVYYRELGRMGPRQVRFGGDALVLETMDVEDLRRFARWYDEKARAAARAKAPETPSLAAMADAGEIETFDAG